MEIVIELAYTPREFLAKRYRVYIKNGNTFKSILTGERDRYGYLKPNAIFEAKEWALLLNCEYALK